MHDFILIYLNNNTTLKKAQDIYMWYEVAVSCFWLNSTWTQAFIVHSHTHPQIKKKKKKKKSARPTLFPKPLLRQTNNLFFGPNAL